MSSKKIAAPVDGIRHRVPVLDVLRIISNALEEAYRIAEKEVNKKAVARLPLEIRASPRGEDIIASNIGRYLNTRASWMVIFRAVEDFNDGYQAERSLPPHTYDEVWDAMYPAVRTMMIGFVEKKQLNPRLSKEDQLVDLIS